MGALQFVFLACIQTDLHTCREIEGPVFGIPISESTCMLEGPAITDAWMHRHPGWIVREWRCRPQAGSDA